MFVVFVVVVVVVVVAAAAAVLMLVVYDGIRRCYQLKNIRSLKPFCAIVC